MFFYKKNWFKSIKDKNDSNKKIVYELRAVNFGGERVEWGRIFFSKKEKWQVEDTNEKVWS